MPMMFWVMSTSFLYRCLHAQAPELMGPCFRRDDEREKSRHCSNFCKHESAISPRISREFCCGCPALFDQRAPCCPRGRRECRAPGAPAASCAKKSTRVRNHGHAGITRHSPRNGFNGFLRALPGDRALLSPSSPRSLLLENLTPASGRQNHTTSPSAMPSAFVNAPLASTASRANVRDDRETPL